MERGDREAQRRRRGPGSHRVDAHVLRDFGNVLAHHKDRAKYITPMIEVHRQELSELTRIIHESCR